MKKVIILLLAICLPLLTFSMNVEGHITFVKYDGISNSTHGGPHRVPPLLVYANQKGHSLSFKNCTSCNIFIYDEKEVVGSAYIDENGHVEIPSYIEGTVLLVIVRGSMTYQANVEFLP